MMIRFYSATFFRQDENINRNMIADANMTSDEAVNFLEQHKIIYADTYGFIPIMFEEIENGQEAD